MAVPAYYRSRQGRMFRVQRAAEQVTPDCARYALRAFPVGPTTQPVAEAVREVSADDLRDRIQRRLAIQTPEHTFEQLWQGLRLELDGL